MDAWGYLTNHDAVNQTLSSLAYGQKHLNHFIFENNQISVQMSGGMHLQGVLNILDNYEEDGGFQIVPGFVNHFDEWRTINEGSQLAKAASERNR